jgi:DNA polymerase-3 subunit beta
MDFMCDRNDLAAAMGSVQKAVSAKTNVPMLEGVYISVGGDRAVLYCTDNEIAIEYTIAAAAAEPGEMVLNAKLFGDIVRNLRSDRVRVRTSANGSKASISSGESTFDMLVIQAEAFPAFPEIEGGNVYRMDQFALKKMMSQTSFAISTDESRRTLTGLFLESEGDEIRACAVDGFRIALRKQVVEANDAGISAIIPSRTVSELIKIIPSENAELSLHGNKNQAMIAFGNCRMFTRVIDGEFFNYKYIIPSECVTQVTVRRAQLIEALEGAMVIIAYEQLRKRPVVLSIANDAIKVRALSDVGAADLEVKAGMVGEDIEVGFNPHFFMDALKAIEDETILIKFTTKVGQCVIMPVNNDSYTYLILPVKIGDL